MKQLCLMILSILTAFAILLLLCGAGTPDPPYLGTWELDAVKTSEDIADLYMLFGSSLRTFGARLELRPDGTMDYYIGLTGGRGTYAANGNSITADVISYTESAEQILHFDLVTEDKTDYLVFHFNDGVNPADLWWTKVK